MIDPNQMTTAVVELTKLAMQQVLDDWRIMIEFETELVEAVGEMVPVFPEWHSSWNQDWAMLMRTRIEGDAQGNVTLVFPRPFVNALVAKALCMPAMDDEGKKEPPSQDCLEAFQEMMNLLCGSFNSTMISLGKEMRVSQAVDDLHVTPLAPEGEQHEDVPLRGLGVAMQIRHGDETHEVLQLLPIPLARAVASHQP